MSRPRHYSPVIERFLVSVLYHEARHRQVPMTRLTNEIIKLALANSVGWQVACQSLNSPAPPVVDSEGRYRDADRAPCTAH